MNSVYPTFGAKARPRDRPSRLIVGKDITASRSF
jgi:hypothetical protein